MTEIFGAGRPLQELFSRVLASSGHEADLVMTPIGKVRPSTCMDGFPETQLRKQGSAPPDCSDVEHII